MCFHFGYRKLYAGGGVSLYPGGGASEVGGSLTESSDILALAPPSNTATADSLDP